MINLCVKIKLYTENQLPGTPEVGERVCVLTKASYAFKRHTGGTCKPARPIKGYSVKLPYKNYDQKLMLTKIFVHIANNIVSSHCADLGAHFSLGLW